MSVDARIIILNYNGADLLKECLPSIVEAAGKASRKTAVTVLDNQSTDASLEFLSAEFPDVAVYRASQNRVLCSYNEYLGKIDEEVVILLNNDIRVDPGFVDPLLKHFSDKTVFLSAPKVMSYDGAELECGATRAGIKFGQFWASGKFPGYREEAERCSETYSSGFGAFDRKKFMELGGYDDRFFPGIMEDTDLCYRASLKGYRNLYEPASVVYHMGQATFKKEFGDERTKTLAARNSFLFMWKNFKGTGFWVPHLFFLPLRLVFNLCRGRFYYWNALKQAFNIQRAL